MYRSLFPPYKKNIILTFFFSHKSDVININSQLQDIDLQFWDINYQLQEITNEINESITMKEK